MDKKRNWLIALVVVVLIAAAGVGTSCHRKATGGATGGELVLTGATDPGVNAFMPPAASPPPTATEPAPTLQPQGDGTTVATQPLPGDRDGLYGGTVNSAECDREKMITFLGAHPAQAGAFVDALNSDADLYWSGGRTLTAVDVPTYLRELTPVVLRLDIRVTNHGFDGSHFTTVQSVFQAGTAVLVDAHGVPRVRGYSGSPLTGPIALAGAPKIVGTPWPGYRPGALASVHPSTVAITNFVLVDVVTGHPFNRPAATTGTNDTPHTQAVAPPQPAPATPTTAQTPEQSLSGTYVFHYLSSVCGGYTMPLRRDEHYTFTQQGNTIHIAIGVGDISGPLNADGSFVASGTFLSDQGNSYTHTWRGVFATEGGRTVIRDGEVTSGGAAMSNQSCHMTFTATKQ